ncbi:glycosyltransferase family 2 protein [Microbacterium sp. zg.Y625]|uniref:glycosyltransferase family 2 protein n=1 Tax=Microbacterium jiangjiandongii TaxID=3049071 RepID=UPI00214ABDE3|nr:MULTISPECIES: glycosyltransferase family 2 protein [unclassified Microbacterium]MCR2793063.1 glycosyltransferase family 2 protein [Microbacterium sp. zg.Y625]WIM24175.1 glycosyltransferase family 2 protein [Microbacterium sp. zg-Y625]
MDAIVRSAPAPAPARRVVRACELAVIIPAHNEADAIAGTLDALAWQTAVPRRFIVVADNCTDATGPIAAAHGADVMVTEGNRDRKAGALNQALASLGGAAPRFVLVLDADTRLAPEFIDAALRTLTADDALGAVSGLVVSEQPGRMLQQFQADDHVRYGTHIRATGRVSVVTGTASMFRTAALRDVAGQRGATLPGQRGDVYDRAAIIEDSELTLALKTCGWGLVAPEQCVWTTELTPTWGGLHSQRVRW